MTGGTGFIGKELLNQLVLEGHHVHVLTRYPKKHTDTAYITYISDKYPMKRLPFIHAVINLAGESIFGYWSSAKKNKMLNSRLDITHKLTKMMIQMEKSPTSSLLALPLVIMACLMKRFLQKTQQNQEMIFLDIQVQHGKKQLLQQRILEFALFIHDSVLYWINIKEHYLTWLFLSKQVSEVKLEAVHNGCRGFI